MTKLGEGSGRAICISAASLEERMHPKESGARNLHHDAQKRLT